MQRPEPVAAIHIDNHDLLASVAHTFAPCVAAGIDVVVVVPVPEVGIVAVLAFEHTVVLFDSFRHMHMQYVVMAVAVLHDSHRHDVGVGVGDEDDEVA